MGKSGRHKKLNRQEKAKTQLKGVKKLLKAQNVVNPTLKVKRIVIREQLAEGSEGQVSTRRHQTLHELLSTMHHHNTNLRKDAVTGLLELVVDHPIVLKQNLDRILERVAALTSDFETVVRKENLKVAEAVFQRVEDTEVQSFWTIILTHLKCALTHLNPSVRYGTLPFLQLLILYFPRLVVGSISTVLSSLIGLISSSNAQSSTHLKVEISGKHGDLQERLRVFALIGSCLELYNNPNSHQLNSKIGDGDIAQPKTSVSVASTASEDKDNQISIFSSPTSASLFTKNPTSTCDDSSKDKFGQKYLGLYYPYGYETLGTSNFGTSVSSGIFDSMSTSEEEESEFWSKFVQSCVACLTQSWVEVGPSASSSTSSGNLGDNQSPKTSKTKTPANLKDKDGKVRQKDFNTAGCDKIGNGFMSLSNGNGSSNLNAGAVDTLKSLVTVMAQLLLSNPDTKTQPQTTTPNPGANFKVHIYQETSIEILGQCQGGDLSKYFFNHLPFMAIQDAQKRTLTTINLQLFLLAAHLRLLNPNLRRKFEILVNELIEDSSLDSEQCDLILRFLCCDDPNQEFQEMTASLATDFITCILSMKDQRREMCKFLWRVLRPDNKNKEELILVEKLNWDVMTPKLIDSFSRISTKLVNLLTHIAIRNLSNVKCHLTRKINWFEGQLSPSTPSALWNECIRLFWYAGALPEFKKAMAGKIPPDLIDPLYLENYV